MRIKKVSQTTPVTAQVVDGYSTSTTDAYSANYVNNMQIGTSNIDWEALESDGLAYLTGNTYTINSTDVAMIGTGFVTSGQSRAWISLPLGRIVVGNPSITINSLYGAIRNTSGTYVSGGAKDWATNVVSASLNGSNLILSLNISGLSNLPANNTPIVLSVETNAGMNFTLS